MTFRIISIKTLRCVKDTLIHVKDQNIVYEGTHDIDAYVGQIDEFTKQWDDRPATVCITGPVVLHSYSDHMDEIVTMTMTVPHTGADSCILSQ
ncbi:hypothetical protein ACN47E_000710 [Coniothyrium glycines]